MLIPRFTIRSLLALTTVCGVFFLVCSFAFRGQPAAIAVTLAVAGLAAAFACYGTFFAVAWGLAGLISFVQRRPAGASPFATAAPPPQILPPDDPE